MADDLDPIDHAILEILSRDARTPISKVAESVGLSRPAAGDRIEKLTRRGVLCGTTAVLDPFAIGLDVTAFVFARGSTLEDEAAAKFAEILGQPEILEAHSVAGDDCYLIKVRTDTIQTLNTILSSINGPPLSLSTRTTIVLATHCEKVGGISLPREDRHDQT